MDICFGTNGVKHKVHERILAQFPKLKSNRDPYGCGFQLADVTEEAGHVVIHHLYTGNYECLRPLGVTLKEKNVAEFKTSLQVYTAARTYELHNLKEQAQAQIETLGSGLDLAVVIHVVEHTYPFPSQEESWFVNYLKARSMRLLTNTAPVEAVAENDDKREFTIAGILLQIMVDYSKETRSKTAAAIEAIEGAENLVKSAGESDLTKVVKPTTDTALGLGTSEPDWSVTGSLVGCDSGDTPDDDELRHGGDSFVIQEEDCVLGTIHVGTNGWKKCLLCRDRVRRQSEELKAEEEEPQVPVS